MRLFIFVQFTVGKCMKKRISELNSWKQCPNLGHISEL